MQKNEKNIYQRVLAIMKDVSYIQKGEKLAANQYRYVSHDQVSKAIHDKLVENGVVVIPTVKSLVQDGNRTTVCLDVKFVNADKPEDFIQLEYWGYGVDTSDKGPGKAISYAFKYACLKMFCLETGDDPDHDQEVEHIPDEKLHQRNSDANLPQITNELSPEAPKLVTIEQFYDKIFPFIPFINDPSFGSLKNAIEYMNTMVTKTLTIPKIIQQALASEKRMQDFCNSWANWHQNKQK